MDILLRSVIWCDALFLLFIHLSSACADDDGNNTWPEILKFLFDCASSGNVELKESALIIFR